LLRCGNAPQPARSPSFRSYAYYMSCVAYAVLRVGEMRDWMADWRKWTPAERALAVAILMSMMAVPVGMLLGFTRPA
jgi:hypothetical protein